MVTMNDVQTTTPITVKPIPEEMNSDYEKCREERIKENLERMQKLGIYDLSLKLKSVKPNSLRKKNKTPDRCLPPLPSSVPSRRSSRLQSTPAVSYAEVDDVSKRGKDYYLLNAKPEVYTEEDEKALGEAKREWTLFVDGYGKDGKRIYDQVRGKTCHQCRQKTLGHRTHCIKCNLVQGQFCGDCLYMRYGENVLEAMENPEWICPVCRGICNCSLCRQAKGWAPTGTLYRKISSLGYKSVAHYLIQTRRSDPAQVSTVKRSLSFSKEEAAPKNNEAPVVNTDELQSSEKSLCNNEEGENDKSNVDSSNTVEEEEKEIVLTPEAKPGSRKKRIARQEDSIAGRLRSRRA